MVNKALGNVLFLQKKFTNFEFILKKKQSFIATFLDN